MTRALRIAVVLLALIAGGASFAQAASTDFVVLFNGDLITGEVKSLSRGQLKFSTDNLGTVYIEWDKVVALTTLGQYDVVLRDGRRFVGRLDTSATGGIAIIGDTERTAQPVLEIVEINRIRSGFLAQIDGSADVGASYTKSSGTGQAAFDVAATYRRPLWETGMHFGASLSQSTDNPDTSRLELNINYARFHANGWQTRPLALLEHNSDLGLDLRTTGAVMLSRYLTQSNRAAVTLGGGLAAGRELPIDQPAITNFDAIFALTSSVFTYDFPKTTFDTAVLAFPGLNNFGRIRLNINSKLKREVLRDVYFSFTLYDTFDSRPPTEEADRNDVGFSLSFGWTF